nr:hypothetical protein [Neptunicella marina]
MRAYEKTTGTPIRHLWHNKPSKPDASCLLDGKKLDLEIAHLYGSEKEAMKILGRELSRATREALRELECSCTPDKRLLTALNRILLNKSKKHYHTKRVWLVLRNAHPAWDAGQIMAQREFIEIPITHPFEQIWIVADWRAKSGILRLYP